MLVIALALIWREALRTIGLHDSPQTPPLEDAGMCVCVSECVRIDLIM